MLLNTACIHDARGFMDTLFPGGQQGDSKGTRPSLVRLGSALWLDLDSAILIREQEEVLLTAREVLGLRILVQTMRNTSSYIDALAIAERIGVKDAQDPGHCIEDCISSIRRKLGEVPHHPQILRGRRGLGYRLFPMQT